MTTKMEVLNGFTFEVKKEWLILKDYGSVVAVISTDTTARRFFFFDEEGNAKKILEIGSFLEEVSH